MSTYATNNDTLTVPPRVDRPILVSNLVAGMMCQLLLMVFGLWPLAVLGVGYVVLASPFLAAIYARADLTPRGEVGAWIVTWVLAVAAWLWMGYGLDMGLGVLIFAVTFGTIGFLVWQLLALAVRQLLVSRGSPA